MAEFRQKTQTKNVVRHLANPLTDIKAFESIVQSLILRNPLRCKSYMRGGVHHPPVEKVREMYTAKFVYENANGKQVGSGSEIYNTIDGYHYGIAAVISNIANFMAHGGKAKHAPGADLFAATLKCNDPKGGLYFLKHRPRPGDTLIVQ